MRTDCIPREVIRILLIPDFKRALRQIITNWLLMQAVILSYDIKQQPATVFREEFYGPSQGRRKKSPSPLFFRGRSCI
ncbi:MAG: hypothetical protein JWP81_1348 [Ferruginibacter sp.]|nr:hypothetical protein [Ferruginibacter sp.]